MKPMDLGGFPVTSHLDDPELRKGIWDEPAQLLLIEPVEKFEIREQDLFLFVGRPGVDGIEFGYRSGMDGFWAYYPVDDEFVLLANNIQEFLNGWYDGSITV